MHTSFFSPSTNSFSTSGRTYFNSIAFKFKKLESKFIPVEIFGIKSPPFVIFNNIIISYLSLSTTSNNFIVFFLAA